MAIPQHLRPHLLQHAPGAIFEAESTGENSYLRLWKRNRGFLLNRKENQPAVGLAWFPAITQGQGDDFDELGYLIGIRVSENLTGIPVAPHVVAAAKAWVLALLPGQTDMIGDSFETLYFEYVNKPPRANLHANVESAGFTCAVALLSRVLEKTPHQQIVTSGAIPPQIGAIPFYIDPITLGDEKRRLIKREAPGIKNTIVIDKEGQSVEDTIGNWFGSEWFNELSQQYEISPNASVRQAKSYFTEKDFVRAERTARAVMSSVEDRPKAICNWIIGACRMHDGDSTTARVLMANAHHYLLANPTIDYEVEELESFFGIALLDSNQTNLAKERLCLAFQKLKAKPLPGNKQWKDAMYQCAGSLRHVLHFLGELDDALQIHQKWCIKYAPEEQLARCYQDRSATLLALNRHHDAQNAATEAERLLREINNQRDARTTDNYLRLRIIRCKLTTAPETAEPLTGQLSVETLPTILISFETTRSWSDPETIRSWFNDNVAPRSQPLYKMVCLRGIAYHAETLKEEPWFHDFIASCQEPQEDTNPAAFDALNALLKGDGKPWLRIAPY